MGELLSLFRLPSLPNQASIARHWHLYLYRLGLPLIVLGNLIHIAHSTSTVELIDGVVRTLLLLMLWVAIWAWDEGIVFTVDVAVALIIWSSLINGMIQAALFRSPGGVAILNMSLFWAPVIAVYWGMVFHGRWLVSVVQVMLYYSALALIDPYVMQQSGKSLFSEGWPMALAQGALLTSLMAIFANVNAQMKVSDARRRSAEHRASHDTLTGLLNRRTFSRHLPIIVNMAEVEHSALSMMLIDFDHFKSINDKYGHSAGDKILRKIAKVFISSLRVGDSLYRWGGEEFAFILRDTDAETVAAVAERLREKTEKHYFGLKRAVTVSIGVATYESGETPEAFFKRADAAMLCAKRNGRNRVEVAEAVLKKLDEETKPHHTKAAVVAEAG